MPDTVQKQSRSNRSIENQPTQPPDDAPFNWTVPIIRVAACFFYIFSFCCRYLIIYCAGEGDEKEEEKKEVGIETIVTTTSAESRKAARIHPLLLRSVTPPGYRRNMVMPSILVPLRPNPHVISNVMIHMEKRFSGLEEGESSFTTKEDWTMPSGAVLSTTTIDETVTGQRDWSDDQPGPSFRTSAQRLVRQTSKAARILGADEPEAPGQYRKKWMEKIGISFDH